MDLGMGGVRQSGINARDVAGRDLTNNSQHNYYVRTNAKQLTALGHKFLQEKETNQQINYIIAKLSMYSSVVEEELTEVIGLEKKLENGGYQSYLYFAMRAKELFTKHLFQNQFSESAQKMYAFMLAKVYTSFQSQIYPAILQGRKRYYGFGTN